MRVPSETTEPLDFVAAWSARGLASFADLLGEGAHRRVYVCALDEAAVVKVARQDVPDGVLANVCEALFWQSCSEHYREWLAPVLWLSPCGRALVQSRTSPILADDAPTDIPAIFQDVNASNLGRLGDRVVFHDYAPAAQQALRAGTSDRETIAYVKVRRPKGHVLLAHPDSVLAREAGPA